MKINQHSAINNATVSEKRRQQRDHEQVTAEHNEIRELSLRFWKWGEKRSPRTSFALKSGI